MNPFKVPLPKMKFPAIEETLRGLMWIYLS